MEVNGEGKTLSAIELARNILTDYPHALFVTNVKINTKIHGLYNKMFYLPEFSVEDFSNYNNGEQGVVFLIDEIHTYLNSLLSRGIPLSTITELSQQRKQRKLIIGTSQVYGRMAKPLREQVKNVVLCHKVMKFIQFNRLIDSQNTQEKDGKLETVPVKSFWFFHSPRIYKSYDTYEKINKNLQKKEDNKIIVLDKNELSS